MLVPSSQGLHFSRCITSRYAPAHPRPHPNSATLVRSRHGAVYDCTSDALKWLTSPSVQVIEARLPFSLAVLLLLDFLQILLLNHEVYLARMLLFTSSLVLSTSLFLSATHAFPALETRGDPTCGGGSALAITEGSQCAYKVAGSPQAACSANCYDTVSSPVPLFPGRVCAHSLAGGLLGCEGRGIDVCETSADISDGQRYIAVHQACGR